MDIVQFQPDSPDLTPPTHAQRRWRRSVGVLVMCALLFAGAYGLVRWSRGDGQAAVPPQSEPTPTKRFVGWTKPDFVLVLTGQLHGYLQPCGCSIPQYGGLARRWEFISELKKKGWAVVPLDLGDLYPHVHAPDTPVAHTPPIQKRLKYETAMWALDAMGYYAVGLGREEFGGHLLDVLGQYSLNHPRPRPLAANLVGTTEDGRYHAMNARQFEVINVKGLPRIGVIGLIGKSVQKAVANDPALTFAPDQIPAALKELAKQRTDFNVVLFQTDEAAQSGGEPEVEVCTKWCADQNLLPMHVVLHSIHDAEPPGIPKRVGDAQLIGIGHKGKYVGVLGVWKKGDRFETKYEMALIGPEYDPKPGNPVSKLMEGYAERVKNRGLADYAITRHKTQVLLEGAVKYVGSEMCAGCHQHAFDVWHDKTHHAHAFETLVKATNPGLRQFDGECLQCHTTGFKYETGYNDPEVRKSARQQKKLLDVGCESCHGPGSAHANDPKNMEVRKLINPWAKHFNQGIPEKRRLNSIDFMCQKCHDTENDVHWNFEKNWPKVIHMNPVANNGKKQ